MTATNRRTVATRFATSPRPIPPQPSLLRSDDLLSHPQTTRIHPGVQRLNIGNGLAKLRRDFAKGDTAFDHIRAVFCHSTSGWTCSETTGGRPAFNTCRSR